jgi:hypothetical protein
MDCRSFCIKLIACTTLLFYSSCGKITNWFCGDLNSFEKQSVDSVNKLYGKYADIEPIPCEYIYVNLQLKTEYVDTTKIEAIHKVLFNKETKEGWQSINVYDVNGKYLFSHSFNGKINIKTGD